MPAPSNSASSSPNSIAHNHSYPHLQNNHIHNINKSTQQDIEPRFNQFQSTHINQNFKKELFNIKNLEVHSGAKRLISIDNLTIYKHLLTSFIGPNGAGKSTLLHSLLSQYGNTGLTISGRIDNTLGSSHLVSQGKIAWVGQHERYELPLTALQYALLGVSPQLAWYQSPSHNHEYKANQLLQDFDLINLKDTRVQYLSGGEKQRLSVVRALMQDTDILMLDEPTNHLDIRHQRFLLTYLRDLVEQQHKTVIVVLHDLTHAYRYSDDIILMNNGHLVAQGCPKEVMIQDNLNPVYQVAINAYDTDSGRLFI